jgi:hypothetical protein
VPVNLGADDALIGRIVTSFGAARETLFFLEQALRLPTNNHTPLSTELNHGDVSLITFNLDPPCLEPLKK